MLLISLSTRFNLGHLLLHVGCLLRAIHLHVLLLPNLILHVVLLVVTHFSLVLVMMLRIIVLRVSHKSRLVVLALPIEEHLLFLLSLLDGLIILDAKWVRA